MSQLLEQIAGAVIMGLLAFFLLAVGVGPRLAMRGKYSNSSDEKLWDTKRAPHQRGKGEEVPRYSVPLPMGKAYGDRERGTRTPRKVALSLIVIAMLVS